MGQLRRWGARDPRRVIAWLGGMSLVTAGLVIVTAIKGDIVFLIIFGVALVDQVIEGVIFVPRAWRAMHECRSPSP